MYVVNGHKEHLRNSHRVGDIPTWVVYSILFKYHYIYVCTHTYMNYIFMYVRISVYVCVRRKFFFARFFC